MTNPLIEVLSNVISVFTSLCSFVILLYVLLSWVPSARANPVGQLISQLGESIIGPFRRFNLRIGPIDLAPLVALLVIDFGRMLLLSLLANLA